MTYRVENVIVRRGGTTNLDRVSLEVESGQVHAVIGGDGAGKSTLLKVLAGLDVGQHGRWELPPPGRTGYVPSAGGVFPELTVDENLAFVAEAHRLDGWSRQADRLVERAGLAPFGRRLAANLSGGQRRKLAGVLALLPRPPLVVLDEVTTGVDPVSRLELWRLVAGAVVEGAAAVVATSYLDEAERAGRVTLLHRGLVLASGAPGDIVDQIPGTVIEVDSPLDVDTAWRHGRRWRQWLPGGPPGDHAVTLEDAAVVHELALSTGTAGGR
jgi:ABC-2 type transport system ATP-binding protein